MSTQPKPKNCYSPSTQVKSPAGHTPAQQQFKNDCDINIIMDRFEKNNALDHVSKHQPEYGFTNPQTYHESLNIITQADSMFNDLPAKLRDEFANNPQAFLQFVQDPKNADRAKELGIALSDEAAAAASKAAEAAVNPDVVEPTPEDPGAAPEEPPTPTK